MARFNDETPDLRWFEEFSNCLGCGKNAQGILRGVRNESYGPHCRKCAQARLKNSKKAHAAELAAMSPT